MNETAKPILRKLLSFRQLRDERGITFSRRHLYTLEAERKFPRRVTLGENRVGWVAAELDAWLDAKVAERDAA
ncbi:prophage regulatory protein [Nitrobacteraceae bacterium AZCC 2161]